MYIIESWSRIRPVTVLRRSGDFYTVGFLDADTDSCTRVRVSRLYGTRKQAEAALEEYKARMRSVPTRRVVDGKYRFTSYEMHRRYLLDFSGFPDEP